MLQLIITAFTKQTTCPEPQRVSLTNLCTGLPSIYLIIIKLQKILIKICTFKLMTKFVQLLINTILQQIILILLFYFIILTPLYYQVGL